MVGVCSGSGIDCGGGVGYWGNKYCNKLDSGSCSSAYQTADKSKLPIDTLPCAPLCGKDAIKAKCDKAVACRLVYCDGSSCDNVV